MMARPEFKERENYIHGSNALDYASFFEMVPIESDELESEEIVYSTKINHAYTFVLGFVIIATIMMCVVLLKAQFTVDQSQTVILQLKNDIRLIQRDNHQLQSEMAELVDLEKVYQVATTELGMRLPTKKEVHYIRSQPVSYTMKLERTKQNQEKTVSDFLSFITKGW